MEGPRRLFAGRTRSEGIGVSKILLCRQWAMWTFPRRLSWQCCPWTAPRSEQPLSIDEEGCETCRDWYRLTTEPENAYNTRSPLQLLLPQEQQYSKVWFLHCCSNHHHAFLWTGLAEGHND